MAQGFGPAFFACIERTDRADRTVTKATRAHGAHRSRQRFTKIYAIDAAVTVTTG